MDIMDIMDRIIEAIREALDTPGLYEISSVTTESVAKDIAEKYGFDKRANGLFTILLNHPEETEEWIEDIIEMDQRYDAFMALYDDEGQYSAKDYLLDKAGVFDSKDR